MKWTAAINSVPAMGFWAAVVLGAALVLVAQRMIGRGARHRAIALVVLALGLAVPISRAFASMPFTFVNGTTADATQMNSNLTSLDNRLSLLESSAAVVGVQRTTFLLSSPGTASMTLPLLPGTYTIAAAGCSVPSFASALTATLRVNGVDSDAASTDSGSRGCFTFLTTVTLASQGTVAVAFSASGTAGSAEQINWARLLATRVPSASVTTVTN
jgi:hypothetical protein